MEAGKYYGQMHQAIIIDSFLEDSVIHYTVLFSGTDITHKLRSNYVQPYAEYLREADARVGNCKIIGIKRDNVKEGWKIDGREEIFWSLVKASRTYDTLKVKEVSSECGDVSSFLFMFWLSRRAVPC